MDEFVRLMFGAGFTPGTSFLYKGETYERSYKVNNVIRMVKSDRFCITEQNPSEKSVLGQWVRGSHEPHDQCPGQTKHIVLHVIDDQNHPIAMIIDGKWS